MFRPCQSITLPWPQLSGENSLQYKTTNHKKVTGHMGRAGWFTLKAWESGLRDPPGQLSQTTSAPAAHQHCRGHGSLASSHQVAAIIRRQVQWLIEGVILCVYCPDLSRSVCGAPALCCTWIPACAGTAPIGAVRPPNKISDCICWAALLALHL